MTQIQIFIFLLFQDKNSGQFSYRFWILSSLMTLSIPCSIFLLYHLLFDKTLLHTLNYHTTIVLTIVCLIIQLFDISFALNDLRVDVDWKITDSFALFWTFIHYGVFTYQLILFLWTTMERHYSLEIVENVHRNKIFKKDS